LTNLAGIKNGKRSGVLLMALILMLQLVEAGECRGTAAETLEVAVGQRG